MTVAAHVRVAGVSSALILGSLGLGLAPAEAQSPAALEKLEARSLNRPLASLRDAVAEAAARRPNPGPPREVANFRGEGRPAADGGPAVPDAVVQTTQGTGATLAGSGFPGASNNDNGSLLGFLIAPPDTDGEVGTGHFVQMINLLTTIYDKNGNELLGPFASNAFWAGIGGNCAAFNQGDPIVLYDDVADRWLVSQFAFPDSLSSFSQCVAISQTGDPTGAYHRYEFSFDGVGFNDYPKHGIVSDSITMIANLFRPRGPFFNFAGTFLGVMDKDAMYAGQPASLIGFNVGTAEFGFVAGDLDGGGSAPALFGTAMSRSNLFDVWRIDVDWSTENASAARIAAVPITAFDSDFCSASREACIPQPDGGPALETLSDRLMHRLQIRDFGTYRTMVASHSVDAGGGRAGIRWYELRESGGAWSLYQEGTFAPNDGQHRWMPSAAMNAAGDIGIGYMLASQNTYVSTAAAGQSAAATGSGLLDSEEILCAAGSGVQLGVNRAGDYSATSVDPTSDSFWHTNEVFTTTGNFQWATFVCEFSVGTGEPPPNSPPTASFTSICSGLSCDFTDTSTDTDGSVVSWSWSFGDGGSSTVRNPSHIYASAGDYTVSLTVTDDDSAPDDDSQTVSVSEPGNATSVSVASISLSTVNAGGGNKRAQATVLIEDDQGNPAGSLTVTGDFTGDLPQTGVSAVTGANGAATLQTTGTKRGKLAFQFCVTNVAGGSLPYDPAGNAVTCASL
jgi:PKD repeat protein